MRNAPILANDDQRNNRRGPVLMELEVVQTDFGVVFASQHIRDALGRLQARTSWSIGTTDFLVGWRGDDNCQRTASLDALCDGSLGVGS
jgi:hypothetical protein